jgi:hypothetical protein
MRYLTALLLAGLAFSAAADALFAIEADTRTLTDTEWAGDAVVVHVASDYVLLLGDPSAFHPERVETVDDPAAGLDRYRLVTLRDGGGPAGLEALGTVVLHRGRTVVLRLDSPAAELPPVVDGVHFIQPLEERRIAPPATLPMTDRGYDDLVADIVSAVEEDSILAITQQLQDYGTRYSSTDNFDTACNWMESRFEAYGLSAEQQTFPMGGYDCQNVIAEQPGTQDSTKIYIICGHLDSTSPYPDTDAPGADDNGSGSTGVLEAARVMSGYDFKYTVRYLAFGGEEQGLYGSDYYAEQASAAGEDIMGVVNMDMVYYGPPGNDQLWVVYDTQSTGLGLAMDAITDTYVPALEKNVDHNPGLTASDHASFWDEGYPALLNIEVEVYSNPYYHQTSDILDNYLEYFPFGTNCIRGAIATVAYLAEPVEEGVAGSSSASVAASPLSVTLSPNPTSGAVSVSLSRALSGPSTVEVFDLSGRCLMRREAGDEGSAAFSLGTSALPAGLHILRVTDGDDSATASLVVTSR